MDEMRRYRVSFEKLVQAVDETMAQVVAEEHIRAGERDNVTVVMIETSVEDRVNVAQQERAERIYEARRAGDYSESLADA